MLTPTKWKIVFVYLQSCKFRLLFGCALKIIFNDTTVFFHQWYNDFEVNPGNFLNSSISTLTPFEYPGMVSHGTQNFVLDENPGINIPSNIDGILSPKETSITTVKPFIQVRHHLLLV
jgi:hypothetical protein